MYLLTAHQKSRAYAMCIRLTAGDSTECVCAYAFRHHHKVEPASHGSNDPGNDSNTELSKEGIKGHKEELKNMQVLISQFTYSHVICFLTKLVNNMPCMYCRTKLQNMTQHQTLQTRTARYRAWVT